MSSSRGSLPLLSSCCSLSSPGKNLGRSNPVPGGNTNVKNQKAHEEGDRGTRVAGKTKTSSVVKAAKGVRAQASRRSAEGKFTKIIFNQIGGKECRRFAAMTWRERDAFMAKPENAAVRERYEKHLTSAE